jgi:hypothetical protein
MAVPVGSKSPGQRVLAYGTYHLGRIAAYALLGFLFGLLGHGLQAAGFQQGISVAAGVVMLMVIWFPKIMPLQKLNGRLYTIQGKVQGFMAKRLRDHRAQAILGLGFFNGFLPCGMVYIALAGAIASQHAAEGAAFMALFGLGTFPALFMLAMGSAMVSERIRPALNKYAPILASIIAVIFIVRGLGLGIPFLSPEAGFIISSDNHCAP